MGAKLTFLNTVKWLNLNRPGKHRNKLQPILDYSKTCVKDDFIRAGSIYYILTSGKKSFILKRKQNCIP